MGQQLRLHFQNKDHTFRILNDHPITRETSQTDLVLDEIPLVIIKNGHSWTLKEDVDGLSAELISAIVQAIAMRFRI